MKTIETIRISNLTREQRQAYLNTCADRASVLQPRTGLAEHFRGLATRTSDESIAAYRNLAERVGMGDLAALAEYRDASIRLVNNLITANSNWLSHFEEVTLQDNEIPEYKIGAGRQEMKILTLGSGKGRNRVQPVIASDRYFPRLEETATPLFEFQLRDIYRGSGIREAAMENIDMAADISLKIDKKAQALVVASIGNFKTVLTNPNDNPATWTFRVIGNVNMANLPTTNALVTSGTGASTQVRLEMLKTISQYMSGFGDMGGHALRLKTIRIPSKDFSGWLSSIQVSTQTNSVSEQVMSKFAAVGGAVLSFGGLDFPMVPDQSLAPKTGAGDGFAIVAFQDPLGFYYTKPSQDTYQVDLTTHAVQNFGTAAMSKVNGLIVPEPNRIQVAQVQY